ncbi:MAG: macro domain-containing protein [Candidatus Limnocylindrales bacterium]|jgi:O-acetyl-ADP-ribose deacetylase (regulator of RNase III)
MNGQRRLEVPRPAHAAAWIELQAGDITTIRADAIVNAANQELAGGGGVDGAIHHAAGPELAAELRSRYRGCPTGSAVITGSGRMAEHGVKWIVHAVGPIWRGGSQGEEALLRSAYATSLHLADHAGARTVAFPAISAGVYGYPLDRAAAVALKAVRDALAQSKAVELAVFVLFGAQSLGAFEGALADLAAEA